MRTEAKDARLDLRMTTAQRNLIERAAGLSGSTVTGFAVARLVDQARKEVERSQRILLDAAQWETFTAILDAPGGPDDPAWLDLMGRSAPWADT
ncbi:MAG: DUF1778 domain-containing protein [Bifidobacteriaceae bacterium]|jgi:uncharacterized protein (DUF1778 family)|nr:DUF1778 domain-containing protein [Bifidobacteriaceae bacterium]